MLIAYTRVSTDAQADSGLGLEAQISSITKSMHKPDEIYSDKGISGSRADRPELLKALACLKSGDTLAVAKMDRLARDLMLSLWIEKEVKKRGAVIASAAGEGTGSNDPASQLMRNVMQSFAEYERQIIGQRTKAALAIKKQRGERVSRFAPYGYELVDDKLKINVDEVIIIRRAFRLKDDGLSLTKIAGQLNDEGYPARNNKTWTKDMARRLLCSHCLSPEDDHSPVPSCK